MCQTSKAHMKKYILTAILGLGLAVVSFAQGFHTTVGESFPEFSMPDTDEQIVSLDDIKGKPSLVLFFGTRCRACIQEIKYLKEEITEDYRDSYNVIVFGAMADQEELSAYKKEHGYAYDFIPDKDMTMFRTVVRSSLPRTYLLDRDGTILSQSYGYQPEKLEALLEKIESL